MGTTQRTRRGLPKAAKQGGYRCHKRLSAERRRYNGTLTRAAGATRCDDRRSAGARAVAAHSRERATARERRRPRWPWLRASELHPLLPAPQTRTLESQFAFIKAPGQFDLPPAPIGKDHAPGIFIGRDRFSGQQIPRGATLATANHEPQGRVAMVGMRHRESEHTAMHPLSAATVPDRAL